MKRRKRYHTFLVEDEIKQANAASNVRIKRKIKEATRDLDRALSLNEEVEMKEPKRASRNHIQTMKKKVRKWKKTTDLFMDLDTTS
jgi:hypothetical protein